MNARLEHLAYRFDSAALAAESTVRVTDRAKRIENIETLLVGVHALADELAHLVADEFTLALAEARRGGQRGC